MTNALVLQQTFHPYIYPYCLPVLLRRYLPRHRFEFEVFVEYSGRIIDIKKICLSVFRLFITIKYQKKVANSHG